MVSLGILLKTTFLLQVWVRRYSARAAALTRTILSWSGPAGQSRTKIGQKCNSYCSPYFMLQDKSNAQRGVVKGYCSLYFVLQVERVGSHQLQRTPLSSVKKKKKKKKLRVIIIRVYKRKPCAKVSQSFSGWLSGDAQS